MSTSKTIDKLVQRKVLLFESNATAREHIVRLLLQERSDWLVDVDNPDTLTEALACIKEAKPDCVIISCRPDGINCVDALKGVKSYSSTIPVIVLMEQSDQFTSDEVIEHGAAGYFAIETLDKTSLVVSIENAMSRTALKARLSELEAERREFISILIHDLRSPLRNVKHVGELVCKEAENGNYAEMTELLAMQTNLASEAAYLLERLNDYAMLNSDAKLIKLSLGEVALAATDNLHTWISTQNARVDIGDLPTIEGNLSQLVLLFQQLVNNAITYNRNSAPVVVIGVVEESSEGYLISVTDNGIGIPDEELTRIFKPLKRLWRQKEFAGAGLGLSICQRVMTYHQGHIWCESDGSTGSSFMINFPKPTI